MAKYRIVDEKIEVGDIVSYEITWTEKKKGNRPTRSYGYVLGVWEEYWDETFKKFRCKVECVDKDNHVVYNEKWLRKVVLI